jgi:hypothetical protein
METWAFSGAIRRQRRFSIRLPDLDHGLRNLDCRQDLSGAIMPLV